MMQPQVYILCGFPFSGKTTLAKELARRLGLAYVSIDDINTERGLGLDGNNISPQDWEETYRQSYARLVQCLGAGQSVIFDAVNFTRDQRDELRAIAEQQKAAAEVIYVDVPEAAARQRWQHNREIHLRHDVRDDNFATVVDNFQAPTEEEVPIRYDQSLPVDEWIERTFLQG